MNEDNQGPRCSCGRPKNVAPSGFPELLTTRDVARLLGVTRWVICDHVRRGRLRAFDYAKEYRFTPEMVKRFIETHRR